MTDKNPLAHYSGVLSEAVQESAAADVPASGAAALSQYLKDCEQHSVVPDVGGAFAFAFAAGFNLATTQAAPIAWPKDAQDVRDFFRLDFITAQFPAQDQAPCDEDRYVISAHDFLSAVNWWADFPHVPREPQAAPTAVAVPAQALTGEARAEAIKRLAPIRAKLATAAPAQAAPAAVAVPDERAAFEATNITGRYYRSSEPGCADEYADPHTQLAWKSWQARTALAATPAIVQTNAEAAAALGINSALTRIRAGKHAEAIAPLEHALQSLAPTPAAAAPVVLPEPDRIAANLMRFVGLDKDTARKCQEVMRCALLAGVSAPAAQAVEADDQMALTFHHAITDGSIGQDDLNEIKIGLRAVLANVQAGARDAERMAAFADAAHQGNEAFERAMHTFRERRDGETGLEYMRSMIDAAIAAQAAQQGGGDGAQ